MEFTGAGKSRLMLFTEDDGSPCGKFGYAERACESDFISQTVRSEDAASLQSQYGDQRRQQRPPESETYPSLFVGSTASLSSNSSLSFMNRFKRRDVGASEAQVSVYSERDSLKASARDSSGLSQHKSYGADRTSEKDLNLYTSCRGAGITEGNNNTSKRASRGGMDGTSIETGDPESFKVRKLSLACSLKGSGTQVTLQRSSSAASSLVNLGAYEADEGSWRRARYFLLVYIAASTCLAITTQVWPTQHVHQVSADDTTVGQFNAIAALGVHSHPESLDHISHESFSHVHQQQNHRKAFDSRIEEGGQYDVVMPGGSSVGCIDLDQAESTDRPVGAWWAVLLLCFSLVAMLVSGLCIAKQPQNRTPLHFKTPYVPLVPLLALSGNMLLLASLPVISWSRFALWTLAGKGLRTTHDSYIRHIDYDFIFSECFLVRIYTSIECLLYNIKDREIWRRYIIFIG